MATSTSTWLVTGASRGIGLEYVRQIVKRGGDTVFATVRSLDKAVELRQLQNENEPGSIEIIELDVCNAKSIASAARLADSILQDRGLDYLISNAGILNDTARSESPSTIKPEELLDIFQTNVVGSILVYQNFLPLLERSKRPGGPVLVNISTGSGSIARVHNSTSASYSISKAALNMLTAKQALEKPNIVVLSMAPGWVKTEMGGSGAIYEAEFSVRGQLKSIVAATHEDTGKFKVHNGTEYPW